MPTLEWIGKDKVINHHLDVPYRVLERKYSYDETGKHDEDNGSKNIIIHGDNLDALKSLLPRYEGRVKCIYIDPPYNTGNEKWVYNDNVNDPRILKWLGQVVGAEGEDLSRHDKWLCMMYPRLKLLQRLLSDDGVIFISIDDTEYANLKCICDEIFGSNCFVSNISWQRTYSMRNDASVVSSLSSLTIPSEYSEAIEYKFIADCFSSAVDFKASTQPPKDRIERITFELSREKRSKAIEQYVKTGELKLEKLQEEVNRFIEENVINLIPADDPYKQLQQEYYLHSQSWCEEQIEGILDKLRENTYPTIAYGEILRPLLILESMGFDKCYLDTAKQLMLTNIENTDHPQAPDDHLVVFEDIPNRVLRAKQVLTEIQNAVAERNNTEKELSLDEILKQEDWVDQLTPFVERHNLKDDPYGTVFSSVGSEIWVALLNDASPEVLTKFRKWFHWVYPTNFIRQNRGRDIEMLKEIDKEIDPDKADDLIVKNLRRWLRNDIEKVCSLYSQGG